MILLKYKYDPWENLFTPRQFAFSHLLQDQHKVIRFQGDELCLPMVRQREWCGVAAGLMLSASQRLHSVFYERPTTEQQESTNIQKSTPD